MPQTTIFVGNYDVYKLLEASIHEHEISDVSIKPDPQLDGCPCLFGRDWRVVRHDGSHLIPFSLDDPEALIISRASIPPISGHFFEEGTSHLGVGFDKKFQQQALKVCRQNHIPYELGKSVIEGGNCKLFKGRDNQLKAIIGLHSLTLSYLSLERHNFFDKYKKSLLKRISKIQTPKDMHLFAIRNQERCLEIYALNQKIKSDKSSCDSVVMPYTSNKDFEMSFLAPLTEEDRLKYKDRAIHLQACLKMTKNVIAKELQVSLKNIAFIYQNHFHIDLDLTTTPYGDVLIHDESLAYAALNNKFLEKILFKHYIDAAAKRMLFTQNILNKNKKILSSIGCESYSVPGSFQAPSSTSINFMNGFFIQKEHKSLFFTNGVSEENRLFMDIFSHSIQQIPSPIDIIYISEANPLLSDILTHLHGGLHCLT